MATHAHQESLNRLEALRSTGRLECAQRALEGMAGHSLLKELEVDYQTALDGMNASPTQLESMGMQPTQLEALIKTITRPPLLFRNGKVEQVPLPDFAPDIGDKIVRNEIWGKSVGRVEFLNHHMRWGGTAWVVTEEPGGTWLVVTNRHVAAEVARRNAKGEGVFMRSPFTMVRYGAEVDFNEEVGALPSDAQLALIERFTYLADDHSADVAIGRIEASAELALEPLPLAETDPEQEETVAVIGYPAFDSRNDRTEMEQYFKGFYNVKRFSPGLMMSTRPGSILSHDCTTLGGNSGSPLLSLDRDVVVGLHFAGEYGVANSAVRVSTLKSLLAGERPTQILVEEALEVERADGFHEPEFFDGRAGYDPSFLSTAVPFPKLPDGAFTLATPTDATPERPNELRYTHFGLLYDTARKSPVVTAVNIDGAKSIRVKRGRDKWFFDKRIPVESQLGKDDFPGALDRGHMVRREDPNWGDDEPRAIQANFDTFHYTNASPQHAALNQNKKTWQGLENHILESTRTHGFKASVLTGPLFGEYDPPVDEIEPGFHLPLQYWKVVVMDVENEGGGTGLHATAYLLSQGQAIQAYLQDLRSNEAVEGFGYEGTGFAFGPYKTFQVSIKLLEELSGLDFGGLRDVDPFAATGDEIELPAGRPQFIEIETVEDAVLAAPSAAPQPEGLQDTERFAVQRVFFGTDRAEGEVTEAGPSFNDRRGERLALGVAEVTIPTRARRIGTIPRPKSLGLLSLTVWKGREDPKRHFTLRGTQLLSMDEFCAQAAELAQGAETYANTGFVFMHGFNTKFAPAMFRTAQLAHDLGFDGPAFAYSWPSVGTVDNYFTDIANAENAAHFIDDFLEVVFSVPGLEKVHLVAHSMGNAALEELLTRAGTKLRLNGRSIDQMILAAPDIDAGKFGSIYEYFTEVAQNVTLYANATDRALDVSKALRRGYLRLGDVGPDGPQVVPGVDSIDITEIGSDILSLNHGVYGEDRGLLDDIGALFLSGQQPPKRRMPTLEEVPTPKGPYWRMQA
ncbi:MAG: alpha/beta fold hydrolase [Roseibium sp.]